MKEVKSLNDVQGKVKKYRKLPVEISAVKLMQKIHIKTREGLLFAGHGDYLIEGIEGEVYPCAGSIFKKTYEEVGDKKALSHKRRLKAFKEKRAGEEVGKDEN